MAEEVLSMMFSPKELLYLAGKYGVSYQTLIGDPFRGYSQEQLREAINDGQKSLEMRGLFHKTGRDEYTPDSRMISMIQFLVSPEYSLIINTLNRRAASNQMLLYFKSNLGASMKQKGGNYLLSLFRDEHVLMKNVLSWLKIGGQSSIDLPILKFPSKDFSALLQSSWKAPEIVEKKGGEEGEKPEYIVVDQVAEIEQTLKDIGVPAEETKGIAKLLPQIAFASTMSLMIWKDKIPQKKRQALFLGNVNYLWLNESSDAYPEVIELEPTPAILATAQVRQYIHGEVQITRIMGSLDEKYY